MQNRPSACAPIQCPGVRRSGSRCGCPYAASSAASASLSTGRLRWSSGTGRSCGTLLGVYGHHGLRRRFRGGEPSPSGVRTTMLSVLTAPLTTDLAELPQAALITASSRRPVARIGGEHHPRGVGVDHLLDDHSQADRGRIDALCRAR